MNVAEINKMLCQSLCAEVHVGERPDGFHFVETPFQFADGDAYSFYVKFLPTGGVQITDRGMTMMHLSYSNDLSRFRDGNRRKLLEQITGAAGVREQNGELLSETTAQNFGNAVVRFGQLITQIHDLTFLNKNQVVSTFYEDLKDQVSAAVPELEVIEQYRVPGIARADDYAVDLHVPGGRLPVFVFGVPDQPKARLSTIVIQHLCAQMMRAGASEMDASPFRSVVVFEDQATIPNKDLSRLMNVTSAMVDTLDAPDDLRRKLAEALA